MDPTHPAPCEAHATGSAEFFGLLSLVAHSAHVPLSRVLEHAGLDGRALASPFARVPIGDVRRAWLSLEELARDPLLGLRVAADLEPGAFDLLDHLVRSSATLRAACDAFCRFLPLLSDAGRVWLAESGDQALLCHHAEGALPIVSQLIIGGMVQRGRLITGGRVRIRHIGFMHEARAEESAYRALLADVPVRFGQICDAMAFDRAALALPLTAFDPSLGRVLVRHAEEAIARIAPAPQREEDVLREAALALVLSGHASLERLAERLETTPRTLQRRLSDAGLSHRSLMASVRADLIAEAQAKGDQSLSSLARTLGYATPASLRRAHERWRGRSAH